MSAQLIFTLFLLVRIAWQFTLNKLQNFQRRKPLPHVVADVYEQERYREYLQIVSEEKKLDLIETMAKTMLDLIIVFSPFFSIIGSVFGPNPYVILLATILVIQLMYSPIGYACSWWDAFKIEGKHGLNKQTKIGFIKDYAADEAFGIITSAVLLEAIAFICEHAEKWTNGFSLGVGKSLCLCLVATCVIAGAFLLIALVGLKAKRLQYRYEPLPEGELRSEIEAMLATCKKKVHALTVYDESSKSVSKNAMTISLPWHREIAIADNFLNENDHGELLAVLAHEVGHLKHTKTQAEIAFKCASVLALFALALTFLSWPQPLLWINGWIMESFHLDSVNYYLNALLAMFAMAPFGVAFECFSNYLQRKEEYEADQEAVRTGHGDDLASMLKKAARDELVNVNPHPLIEALEYDHPGEAKRLTAIYEAMGRQGATQSQR